MLNRLARIATIAVLTLLPSGCRYVAAEHDALPPEEHFAREFLRALQDSGSVEEESGRYRLNTISVGPPNSAQG